MTEIVSKDSKTLIGPKVCLMGLSGTGKSYALGTLAEWCDRNSFELAILYTENSLETFLGYFRDKGREPPACVYWHQQFTRPLSLKKLLDNADITGKLTYEGLTKSVDGNRSGDNNAFMQILKTCSDFHDDRTGKVLGPLDLFPPTRIFAIDSLTELGNAAMKMQIGGRPTAAQQDYMVAQNHLINFLRLVTQGIDCPFVMTAHVDRIEDAVSQTTKTMIKAIGRALSTDIPTLFSDVIYCVRNGDKFSWDTAAYGVDVKTRSLGYRSGISPDFALIFDVWAKRAGLAAK